MKALFFIVVVLLLSIDCYGDIHVAVSCSYSDVGASITVADTDDTVSIPPGECDWGGSELTINKAIKLIGAGAGDGSSCVGKTCLTSTGTFLKITTGSANASFPVRISGISMTITGSPGSEVSAIAIEGSGYNWRINNNYFYKEDGKIAIIVGAMNGGGTWTLFGLVDNNTFINGTVGVIGSGEAAEDSWTSPSQWGTANAVFIEDNIFKRTAMGYFANSFDANGGARAVIRYNIFYDARIEAHGSCYNENSRGTRSLEVYNNEFYRTHTDTSGSWIRTRGGSAVITGNYVAGAWANYPGTVELDDRRSYFAAECNGTFGWADGGSSYDGNLPNPAYGGNISGWPALDQIGRGTQTTVLGANPTVQTSDPLYIWGNTAGKVCMSGTDLYKTCASNSDCINSDCSTTKLTPNIATLSNNKNMQPFAIVAGRDYFDETSGSNTKNGWTPYAYPHPLRVQKFTGNVMIGGAGLFN